MIRNLAAGLIIAVGIAAAELPARAASISGTILPPGKVKAIKAFEREGADLFKINNRYHAGTIDPKTGKFEIKDLPDGTYQLLLDCGDATVEGIDLRIDDEEDEATFDYRFSTKKLATQRLDVSAMLDPDEAATEERKAALAAKEFALPKLLAKLEGLRKVDRFADHLRPLLAHGTKTRAFVLVEVARLRDFYAGSGQAIYRVEIWPFERTGDVWDQPTKGIRVLQRHRLDKAAFLRLGAFFEPALGGIRIINGKSVDAIKWTVPDAWDEGLGKAPGRAVPDGFRVEPDKEE